MNTFAEVESAANYADRQALERSAQGARKLGQWELAKKHYESALALLPVDPHRGEHFDAERYRREIRICSAMSNTSRGMRPTRDNDAYRQQEREHERRIEAARDHFWEDE